MNVINSYYLLDEKNYPLKRFKECDFNTLGDIRVKKPGNNIPLTLKEEKDPYLILFYYNSTNLSTLRDWEFTVSTIKNSFLVRRETEELGEIQDINYGFVNLDLEKKIFEAFSEVPLSNPFRWTKITKEDDNLFILFYYKTYPQFFYNGLILYSSIIDSFFGWRQKITDYESEKDTRFKKIGNRFVSDDAVYLVLEDRYLIDAEGKVFVLKKGELYRVSRGKEDTYLLSNQLEEINRGANDETVGSLTLNKTKEFNGKIFNFDKIFKMMEPNKSNQKRNRDIIFESDFVSQGDNTNLKDLYREILDDPGVTL